MMSVLDYLKNAAGFYDPEAIERSRYTQDELERQARIEHLQNIVAAMQQQAIDPALQQAQAQNQAALPNDVPYDELFPNAGVDIDSEFADPVIPPPAIPLPQGQVPGFMQDPRFMMAMGMLASPGTAEQQIGASTLPAHLKPDAAVKLQTILGGSDRGPDWRQQYAFDPATGTATPIEGANPYRVGKGVTVNVGEGEPGRYLTEVEKANQGYPEDSIVWENPKTGPKVVEQFNDSHRKAASYGLRMVKSMEDFDEFAKTGYTPGLIDSMITEANVFQWAQGLVKTKEGRLYKSVVDDFLRALLRKESGATITEPEYIGYYTNFFPNYRDTPEILAVKRKRREAAVSGMAGESGGLINKYLQDYEDAFGTTSGRTPDPFAEGDSGTKNSSRSDTDSVTPPPGFVLRNGGS